MPFVTEELWQRLPRRKCETAGGEASTSSPFFNTTRAHLRVSLFQLIRLEMTVQQPISSLEEGAETNRNTQRLKLSCKKGLG